MTQDSLAQRGSDPQPRPALPYHASVITTEFVEHLRRLEAELVSPDVWQSRAELEARISPGLARTSSRSAPTASLAV